MSADGNTSWFADASDFHVNHGKIVHHGHPQGTRENVSYYPRAKGFSFDTLDIAHFTNGGMPPRPRPPSGLGGSSSSSSSGFPPGGTRPKKPRSTTQDSRSTVHRWLEDYGKDDAPHARRRPNATPQQRQGQYSRNPPFRGGSIHTPFPSGPPVYASYGPDATLPTVPLQPPGSSTYDVPAGELSNLNPGDDHREQRRDDAEAGGWQMSDDEGGDWQMSDDEDDEGLDGSVGTTTNQIYIPRVLEWIAARNPSYEPTRSDLLNIWNEHLFHVPVVGATERVILTTAGDRIKAWRNRFVEKALEYIENHIWPTLTDDTPQARLNWVLSMKPSTSRRPPHPFYFKVPHNRQGSFQSDFLAFTLSSHLEALPRLAEAQHHNPFPFGALALAIQACERALAIWETGEKRSDRETQEGVISLGDVWTLVTTQLNGHARKQEKILEAATDQLGRSSQ